MKVSLIIAIVVLLMGVFALPSAYCETFTSQYGSSTIEYVETALGTHTFKVNTPFGVSKNTEWYLSYSGGSPVETDSSAISDPQYTDTFSPGTRWIRAEVYDGDWNWEESHRWEVTVSIEKANLQGSILMSAGPWLQGAAVSGDLRVRNDSASTAVPGVADLFLAHGAPSFALSNRIDQLAYGTLAAGEPVYLPFSFSFSSSAPTGTYYLTCLVDATGTTDESQEGDNTDEETMDVIASNALPDLICTDIAASPRLVDQASTVTGYIKNQGGQSVGGFEYTILVDGSLVATGAVSELAGTATTPVSCLYTADTAAAHLISVNVDVTSNIVESVEDNNSREESLTWELARADLTGASWFVSPTTINAGDQLTAQLQVANIGNASANSGQVWFFWHMGSPSYSIADRIGTSSYPAIPQESASLEGDQFVVSADSDPGIWYLSYLIDGTDTTDESNESNNSGYSPVTVIQSDKPDLVVRSVAVSPSYAWQPSIITSVISNQGSTAAEFNQFDAVLRIDVDDQQEWDTTWGITIPPGGTYTSTEPVTVSAMGSFAVHVTADPNSDVAESIEDNNSLTISNEWVVSPTADSDSDGMKDMDELVAGTDPGLHASCLRVSAQPVSASNMVLTWASVSGRWYSVSQATNLTGVFSVIVSNLPAEPPQNTQTTLQSGAHMFYRILADTNQWGE